MNEHTFQVLEVLYCHFFGAHLVIENIPEEHNLELKMILSIFYTLLLKLVTLKF
jgi:hypothetical protein